MNKFIGVLVVLFLIIVGALAYLYMPRSQSEFHFSTNSGYMISDFENVNQWSTSPEKGVDLSLTTDHVSSGRMAMKVAFPDADYPSINTKKILADWSYYKEMSLQVFNPGDQTLNFVVRLDDKNRQRVNFDFRLKPGMNEIKLSTKDIGRRIDVKNVFFVVLFLKYPPENTTLIFDKFVLAHDPSGKMQKQEPQKKQVSLPVQIPDVVDLVWPAPAAAGSVRMPVGRINRDLPTDQALMVSGGIPFAQGQLFDVDKLRLLDVTNNPIQIGKKILAKWPDGSIKSVLVQFDYVIPHRFEYITLEWGKESFTASREIIPPTWDFPEATVILSNKWLTDTNILGEHIPINSSIYRQYDNNINEYFPRVRSIPWTGDLRKDGYYSSALVFYQLFVRRGELDDFIAARKELLHYRETQVIHEGKRKGQSNVGPKPRYNYIQALAADYYFTGDPRSYQVAQSMIDYLTASFNPKNAFYPKRSTKFWTERVYAFVLINTVAFYELSGDKKYLDLAGKYVKQLIKTQDQWPDRGGFIHNLYSHDPEEGAAQDEYGGSPFMTGLLLEGLIKYHRITNDREVAKSILKAVEWVLDEGLAIDETSFKYLTARKYADEPGKPDLNMLIIHSIGYAYRLSGFQEERYKMIGDRLFNRGVKDAYLKKRKHFNQNYRSSGHYLAYVTRRPQQIEVSAVPASAESSNDGYDNIIRFKVDDTTKIIKEEAAGNTGQIVIGARAEQVFSRLQLNLINQPISLNRVAKMKLAYKLNPNTPVTLRVKTSFGDWVCVAASQEGKCDGALVKEPVLLVSSGQWQDVEIPLKAKVHSLLAGIKSLSAIEFDTDQNAAQGDEYRFKSVQFMQESP